MSFLNALHKTRQRISCQRQPPSPCGETQGLAEALSKVDEVFGHIYRPWHPILTASSILSDRIHTLH